VAESYERRRGVLTAFRTQRKRGEDTASTFQQRPKRILPFFPAPVKNIPYSGFGAGHSFLPNKLLAKEKNIMKRALAFFIATLLLGISCNGESTTGTMTIEILEFDCTEHPDLFEKYASCLKPNIDSETGGFNSANYLSKQNEVLKEVEQVATKTIALNHSQGILIGTKVDLITQLQDYEFKLNASTETRDNDLIHITLDTSLSMGEYDKRSVNTEVTVRRGQIIPMGGSVSTQTTQDENGETREVKTVSTMQFTIK
jgi:hypothetical protein